ncbi:MAG: hypothetical protein U0271_22965 [Polyangiaceae bacterium]
MGRDHLLVGVSSDDPTTQAGAFDLRYLYLSGGLPDSPCDECTACSSHEKSCANGSSGCLWWGCWQSDREPPGAYLRRFLEAAEAGGQIPMITYYEVLQASGAEEGKPEVRAMADPMFLKRFFDDYRLVLEQVGNRLAILHIEPDFWGYAQHVNDDPHAIDAPVPTANPTDCPTEEASIAGLGRCMLAMTRKYAPRAKFGLHGSPFATRIDVVQNRDPHLDLAAHARALASFLYEAAPGADLVVIDGTDRDAGYDLSHGENTAWDATNETLPTFSQAVAWSRALAEAIGKPTLWWQIPVGNSTLPDEPRAWRDNRVEYFFAHWDEVAAAHSIGVAFGAAEETQTTPETDGGLLLFLADEYRAAGGYPLCEGGATMEDLP